MRRRSKYRRRHEGNVGANTQLTRMDAPYLGGGFRMRSNPPTSKTIDKMTQSRRNKTVKITMPKTPWDSDD